MSPLEWILVAALAIAALFVYSQFQANKQFVAKTPNGEQATAPVFKVPETSGTAVSNQSPAVSAWGNPLFTLLLGALVAGAVFYALDRRDFVPVPPSPNPEVLSLVSSFETNNNRAEAKFHARVFGTLCSSLADCIEYDSKLTNPRIQTGRGHR